MRGVKLGKIAIVYCSGTLTTDMPVITVPIKYKPANTKYHPCWETNANVFRRLVAENNGNIWYQGGVSENYFDFTIEYETV